MDMILFEVFWKSVDLIPQQILQWHYLYYITDSVKLYYLFKLVESSGYSSKTLKKGSCLHAPLDEVLRYIYGIKSKDQKHNKIKPSRISPSSPKL